MTILILNASPRPRGIISQMLGIIRDEAERRGATVEVEHVQQLSLRPCMGCMKCRSSHQCVLPQDDAQRILRLIDQCDALIIGAPCYWGNMPGTLKLLFDRIVYGMMGETPKGFPKPLHKGKRAVVVTSCTTPWPFNILYNQSRGVVRALREILGWSGFKMVATIQRGDTRSHPTLTDKDRRKCLRVVDKLI